jgi:outer membrane protein OmpA-like peptidoglycan-associated protein
MEKIFGSQARKIDHETSAHWVSVSDLMSGLMMVFLFISISFMRHVMIERDKIKQVAVAYQDNQVELYNKLEEEFKNDLKRWNAEIDRETLSFQFKSPDILFANGSSEITPQFREVLNDFFPRYMLVLNNFKDSINEVRIEGHTSSNWRFNTTLEDAYFKNMELSQARTRSVLFYVQSLPQIRADQDWVKRNIAAVGLSSSKPILTAEGVEDPDRSRRVTLRVITNAETQIRKLIQD